MSTVDSREQLSFPFIVSSEEDLTCQACLLFEELAQALRLSVGTLRNWKYEGLLTPIHSIGRRPHFRIASAREELMRKGKIRKGNL